MPLPMEGWAEDSSVCLGYGSAVARGHVTADPKHRLTIKCLRKMFPSLNYNGNQGLLGLGHPSFPPPCYLPSQSHYLEVPGLNFLGCVLWVCAFFCFFSFMMSSHLEEVIQVFPHAALNRSDRFFSELLTMCPRKQRSGSSPCPSVPWQPFCCFGKEGGKCCSMAAGRSVAASLFLQSLLGKIACPHAGSQL